MNREDSMHPPACRRLPSRAPFRALLVSAALLPGAIAAVGGCAATGTGPDPGDTSGAAAPATSGTAPVPADDLGFGRTLQTLDRRVTEFHAQHATAGEDARGRKRILEAALASDVGKSMDRLLALAADPSEDLRHRIAVKAIGFGGDARAVAPLSDVLATSTDAGLLTDAGYGLARLRNPATPIAPLLRCAEHRDPDVRNNALLALWHVLDARAASGAAALDDATRARALGVIENALFDPDVPPIRGHAAAAMGALGDTRGVDPLVNLLRDTNSFVRLQTALALGKLGDRRAADALVDIVDETPRGNVRDAVLLAITALIEQAGFSVPPSMSDEERAWRALKERTLGRTIEVPDLRERR
jgi:HEAT repeat protein